MSELDKRHEIWFVYDGECPLCKNAALALRIKHKYGNLNLLNARENLDHSLIKSIFTHGFDLDEGMIIYTENNFYHGADALFFMAQFSEGKGAFNINKGLFFSKTITRLTYPWLRGARNLLLKRRGITKIDNLDLKNTPIFKSILGESWNQLPIIMHKHYANRPYSDDITTVEGTLDVMCAGPIKWFSPIFQLMGSVPPFNERDVPVTVQFKSNKHTKEFHFNRIFHFKNCKPYCFQSRMVHTSGNEVIEIMRFGLGWKMHFLWEDNCIKLKHKGYILKLFGCFIPLPLTIVLGAGHAIEIALDDNSFEMCVEITHPWWGKIYGYRGRFHMVESK